MSKSTAPAVEVDGGVVGHTCWNTVGVFGANTCEQLAQFVHCRNCPTYSSAALQLLSRKLPLAYRRERTAHFAEPRPDRSQASVSAVLFRVASEWLAFPTHLLQEISEHRSIHSLPHRRLGAVLGLANVRGELLICVSLGHLLGLNKLPERHILQKEYERLLVVHLDGQRLAFPVDEVHGPQRFRPEEIKAAPATVARANPAFMQRIVTWREHTVGLLDAEAVFRAAWS